MKHTIESVIESLKKEYAELSQTEWEECGDINLEEYGGVQFRKAGNGSIEIIYYLGSDDLPQGLKNRHETTCELNELIEGVADIWTFSDVANCGLSIGWAIQSLQSYNGFLDLNI